MSGVTISDPVGPVTRWGDVHPAEPPAPLSYWVIPGRLAAGAHPQAGDGRMASLLAAGVDVFVDLTEEATEPPAGVSVVRHPVVDFGLPSPGLTERILDDIDRVLDDGRVVFVHCHAGRGRTGTVVGCWLVRHGADPDTVLDVVARLRDLPGDSPETDAQRAFVNEWR